MRIIKLLFVLALLIPTPLWAAIAFVQGKDATETSTDADVALTWDGNTTSGNTIVCALVVADGDNHAFVSIADSQSNSYTVSAATRQSGYAVDVRIAYAYNITGGTTPTVTTTYGTNALSFGKEIACGEFSGLLTDIDPHDNAGGNAQDNPGTGTDAVTSNAVATDQANELIVGATCCGVASVGTSFTNFVASPLGGLWAEYRIVSSQGSYAGTFTATTGTDDFATRIATFKMAAAASTCRGALSLLQVGGC